MTEANARIKINKLLEEADWILPGGKGIVNVDTEMQNEAGFADYVLKDSNDFPICVIEAKKELVSPLVGKEQARGYAKSLNCRFIILSNGLSHYFWDIEQGSPTVIDIFLSQKQMEIRREFNPSRGNDEKIEVDYIAQTQLPKFEQNPDYLNEKKREEFIRNNKLRLLRDYQLKAVKAVKAVQSNITDGKDRFLLEMAIGTGKSLTSSAIIKMFLRLYNVKRVLFLVDRLELETQAQNKSKQDFIKRFAQGATTKTITKDVLRSVPVPLVDLNEQKETVKQIKIEQSLINGNKRLIDIYTQKIQDRISKV